MARFERLSLRDFRNYAELDLDLAPGTLLVRGANAQGKTNLLEALGWLGLGASFRRVGAEHLIRRGADQAVIRADVVREDRRLLVEVALVAGRTPRVQVNRQGTSRVSDLVGLVPVTVFTPDDLDIVKGAPAGRRDYLDDLLGVLTPANARLRGDLDRVLRQRGALLRQLASMRTLDDAARHTLAVWDTKLTDLGERWAGLRVGLLERLEPLVAAAYRAISTSGTVTTRYLSTWVDGGMEAALAEARRDELRRGVGLVGPHRDDLGLAIDGRPSRTQASQGEQRSLALALRIAGHQVLTAELATTPILLLDDVFSELDDQRAGALMAMVSAEQTVITTAHAPPPGPAPAATIDIAAGAVRGTSR